MRSAQANLDKLLAGSTTTDRRSPRRRCCRAGHCDSQQQLISLSQTELRAPLPLDCCGQYQPRRAGQPRRVALIQLATIALWRIETEDLTEVAGRRCAEGDQAVIILTAPHGVEMVGTVTTIKPFGENTARYWSTPWCSNRGYLY
ncbi:MAG: hypothetical protein R2867_45370 [Caldilineaceae bacterium]